MRGTVFLFVYLLVLGVTVSGCGKHPDTVNTAETNNISNSQFNKDSEFSYRGKQLSMHLINIPDASEYVLYETKAKPYDFSEYAISIKKVFFNLPEAELSEQKVPDTDGYNKVQYSWKYNTPDYWTSYLTVYGPQICMVLDGKYTYNFLTCTLRESQNPGTYDRFPLDFRYNVNAYTDKKIDGFTFDEALRKFRGNLLDAGIDIGELECISLAMDKDTSAKQWYDSDHDGTMREKPDFSLMKDTWYFFARQELQGLPVLYYNGGTSLQMQNYPLRVAVDETSIQYMEIDRMFQFVQTGKKLADLISFNDIVGNIIERFENILGNSTYSIERCGLYYYALGNGDRINYEMVPAWVFEVEEINGADHHTTLLIINALTGEELENIK